MKVKQWLLTLILIIGAGVVGAAEPGKDPVGAAVKTYFDQAFERLRLVAEKHPTVDSLRRDMKPLVDATTGFFGGTLIDTNFVIIQVYFKRDALARGYDLKKVKQLTGFWKKMREAPTPQLSEPGHGNLIQPRLVAMRYPVVVEGKLQSVVSMMVRTESFLKETGLDQLAGCRITCNGVIAEAIGELTGDLNRVELDLPANLWMIEYKR